MRQRLLPMLLLVASVASGACRRSSDPQQASSMHAAPPLVHRSRSTGDLVKDADLAARVDALAAKKRIESAAVGYAGTPSETYKLFVRVTEKTQRADAVALLTHDSPVVRGYMAPHVLATWPDAVSDVYGLLADTTSVETMSGCSIASETIADISAHALTGAAHAQPSFRDVCAVMVNDERIGAELRSQALTTLAREKDPRARSLAAALVKAPDAALRDGAVRALGMTKDDADVPQVIASTHDSKPSVRAASASALGSLPGDASRDALAALLHDPDAYVRRSAAASYAMQPGADGNTVRGLLAEKDGPTVRLTALGLATRGDAAALAILEPVLMKEGVLSEVTGKLAEDVRPDRLPLMRRLLGANDCFTRATAARFLGASGDRASVAALVTLLRGETIHERQNAAEALGKIGDPSAVPSVVLLLGDSNPHGRIAAAKALVTLAAKSALGDVEAAARAETTWAKPELEKSAAALRAL